MYIYDLEKPPPNKPVSEGALFNISSIKKHEENIKWEIIVFLKKKKKIVFPKFIFSINVVNSIKYEKNITPPPPPQTTPTFEIQNQNKGIEDIMDIDSNCPYLLFGETTSYLTSKWRGTAQYFFFNVENCKFYFFQYLKNS